MRIHTWVRTFAVAAIVATTLVAVPPAGAQRGETAVDWEDAPSCAVDDTVGIKAVVENDTGASKAYTIEVRERATNRFVHGSHNQFVDDGEAGRITLGGMPSGTWELSMLENGQRLADTVIMTFASIDCFNEPTLFCGGLEATLVGTSGDDNLVGTAAFDVIVALQGNDTIRGLGGDDIICAGRGDDVIYGGQGFDVLFGAQGADELYAADGATGATRADSRGARMFGGAGNDMIFGSDRWDRMQGGDGADALFGYEGRDWIRAGAGNDIVLGGYGADDLHGGFGADEITMTNGDIVRGGGGNDVCHEDGKPALVRSCEALTVVS